MSKVNRPGLNTGIADSSDATAITIDSSERIGIGVTPERQLHVEGSGAEISLVDTQRTSNSRTANMFIDSSNRANLRMMNDAMDSAAVGVQFDSSGRVTMPNQPTFRVGRLTDYTHTAGQNIQWNHGHFNVGSHFNTASTYVFTAPVAGVYWFQATVIIRAVANGTNLYDALRFRINGAVNGYSSRRGVYNTTSMSHGYFVDEIADAYQLSANDTVGISCEHNVSIHGNNLYTRFNGFLVG